MASTNEESPLASFLANLRREVAGAGADAEADHHCEQHQEQDESTNDDHEEDGDDHTSIDSSSVSSMHVSFTIVPDHARTHQRRQHGAKKRRSTPRAQQDVSPRYPRHHHHSSIQRQLSPVSVSSVESSPEIFSSTHEVSPSSRNSSKRLLQQQGTDLLFAPPLLDSNLSRWEMPSTSVVDRSPGELCKPRRGLDFVSESEASTKELLSSSSSSYGLFVPFTDSQDEEDDEDEDDALEDVRTSRWDAIVSVTKALSIVKGNHNHSHSHHCTYTAPKMIPRKSSLVDLNDLIDESDE